MRRALSLLLVCSVVAAWATGCGNSVDAVDAPTPTPTATPSPTPTGDLSGNYSVVAAVPLQSCSSPAGQVNLTFNASNVAISVSGSDFTPDWGFASNANFSVPDPEHGTISGASFTANYTYCDYDFLSNFTTKHVATWTGTFNQDGSFDSTLTQKLRNASGNLVGTCGATETDGSVTADMQSCTSSGLTWSIHGEP